MIAANAVDGDRTQASSMSTIQESSPWFMVDLVTTRQVVSVCLDNRAGEYEKMQGAQIHMGNSTTLAEKPRCIWGLVGGMQEYDMPCAATGRYVFIMIPGAAKVLNLPEVEIYGWMSDVTICKCNTAYAGPNGGACTQCGAGQYKNTFGTNECT